MNARIIATARSYGELLEAFRARVEELDIARKTLDQLAGLPDGYSGKVFAPVPCKSLGPTSMGLLMMALGLRLDVLVDDAAYIRVMGGSTPTRKVNNGGRPTSDRLTKKHQLRVGDSEWGRVMAARRMLLLSPSKRRQIARIARRVQLGKSR